MLHIITGTNSQWRLSLPCTSISDTSRDALLSGAIVASNANYELLLISLKPPTADDEGTTGKPQGFPSILSKC